MHSFKAPTYTGPDGVAILRAVPKHLYGGSNRRKTSNCRRRHTLYISSPLRFCSTTGDVARPTQVPPNRPPLRPLSDSLAWRSVPCLSEEMLNAKPRSDGHGFAKGFRPSPIASPRSIAPVPPPPSRSDEIRKKQVRKTRTEACHGDVAAALRKNQQMLQHAQEDLNREFRNRSEGAVSRAQKQRALLQKMYEVHRTLLLPREPAEIALLGFTLSVSVV